MCFDEWAVNQYVDVLKEFTGCGLLKECFIGEASVAPYGFVGFLLDAAGQRGECFDLEEGVAASEGDVGKGVARDVLHEGVEGHFVTCIWVPRLGIVAPRAVVLASCAVDAGAKAWAVDGGVVYDVDDADGCVHNMGVR